MVILRTFVGYMKKNVETASKDRRERTKAGKARA